MLALIFKALHIETKQEQEERKYNQALDEGNKGNWTVLKDLLKAKGRSEIEANIKEFKEARQSIHELLQTNAMTEEQKAAWNQEIQCIISTCDQALEELSAESTPNNL